MAPRPVPPRPPAGGTPHSSPSWSVACYAGASAAERARTVLAGSPGLLLRLLDGSGAQTHVPHGVVEASGQVHVPVAADDELAARLAGGGGGAEAAGSPAVVLEGWSVSAAPVADRVRAWLRIDGTVATRWSGPAGGRPGSTSRQAVLVVEPLEVLLVDGTGSTVVGVDAWLAAAPDPLVGEEPQLVSHLARCHRAEVRLLAALAERALGRTVAEPVVVGIDRYGLRLRVTDGDGQVDVRLPFAWPVRDVGEAQLAVATLLRHARSLA